MPEMIINTYVQMTFAHLLAKIFFLVPLVMNLESIDITPTGLFGYRSVFIPYLLLSSSSVLP